MGTNARIGIQNKDGSIDSIYLHWDGATALEILKEHYTTTAKVRKLINLGDLSSLQPKLSPRSNQKHSFEFPVPGVCVAYGRDRKESDVDSIHGDFDSFLDSFEPCKYLWDGGQWEDYS